MVLDLCLVLGYSCYMNVEWLKEAGFLFYAEIDGITYGVGDVNEEEAATIIGYPIELNSEVAKAWYHKLRDRLPTQGSIVNVTNIMVE